MKNKIIGVVGFALGVASFLFLFKLLFLDKISPADELAPGMVVIAALLNGVLFAFIGYYIQRLFIKKRNNRA